MAVAQEEKEPLTTPQIPQLCLQMGVVAQLAPSPAHYCFLSPLQAASKSGRASALFFQLLGSSQGRVLGAT